MTPPPEPILAALRRDFPGYRIWLEPVPGRQRFVACRQHSGTGPHTVVTSDPAELRAALTPPGQQESGSAFPPPRNMPDPPQKAKADDPHRPHGAMSGPA